LAHYVKILLIEFFFAGSLAQLVCLKKLANQFFSVGSLLQDSRI
ncbi:hypothetical protein SS7213T_08022, partial [Staphylococcus simiae CCM 7213 = CCUG 51256]